MTFSLAETIAGHSGIGNQTGPLPQTLCRRHPRVDIGQEDFSSVLALLQDAHDTHT